MRVPARPPPQSCLAEPTDLVQLPATSAPSSIILYAYTTQARFTIPEAICVLLWVQDRHIRPAESPP